MSEKTTKEHAEVVRKMAQVRRIFYRLATRAYLINRDVNAGDVEGMIASGMYADLSEMEVADIVKGMTQCQIERMAAERERADKLGDDVGLMIKRLGMRKAALKGETPSPELLAYEEKLNDFHCRVNYDRDNVVGSLTRLEREYRELEEIEEALK